MTYLVEKVEKETKTINCGTTGPVCSLDLKTKISHPLMNNGTNSYIWKSSHTSFTIDMSLGKIREGQIEWFEKF